MESGTVQKEAASVDTRTCRENVVRVSLTQVRDMILCFVARNCSSTVLH